MQGKLLIAVLFVLSMTIGMDATGALGKGSGSCATLDGKYDVASGSWVGGVAAPGITIDSASDEQIVFSVAKDIKLTRLCVKTGTKLNFYTSDATSMPVYGPKTVTISKAGSGFGLGSISFDTEVLPPCTAEAPDITWSSPEFIDKTRAGGEPVSVVAPDGSINVSAHAGTTHIYKTSDALPGVRDFLWGYTNQTLNWRSEDGGKTWAYTGLNGTGQGPHSLLSTGFSDPDYAMDQAGNLYNVEIDLANDAVYKSTDYGQSWPIAVPLAAEGDRPWIAALEPNEVFLYVNSLSASEHGVGKNMLVSRDPNLLQWTHLPTPAISSKPVPDPLNPDDGLIGPVRDAAGNDLGQFAISGDDAQTWKTYRFGPPGPEGGRNIFGKSKQFFGVVGVDSVGNVYQAAAGGYDPNEGLQGTGVGGSRDNTPNGEVSFAYYERATGRTNQQKIDIPIPAGDALWPWVIAGDEGRVAVVWYQNLVETNPTTGERTFDPNKFYIFAAVTHNATGVVHCEGNRTAEQPPQWTVKNVSGRPIHLGKICLSGTACNANTDPTNGDRRLGDFFTVNFDLDGNLFIVSGDTTLPGNFASFVPDGFEEGEEPEELEGKKPVGNPIFMRQTSGDKMLEDPISPADPREMSSPLPIQP